MDVIFRLLERLGLRPQGTLHQYQLDAQVHAQIEDLARQARVPEHEVTNSLLASALAEHQVSQELSLRWQFLSRREQQVAALTCLGYTNREIAARLGVAPSTVKTHMKSILYKFDLHGKTELEVALHAWDFSEWDLAPQRRTNK